jgi:hypothetical protein
MSKTLPSGFLWGNSVSSMQTEGAWNEGGKGPRFTIFAKPASLLPTGKWRPIPTIVIRKTLITCAIWA